MTACVTTGNALISDIFHPSERGRAMGAAAIPFLVGPVVGPLIGGGLAQALGWRSTFAALAIFSAAAAAAQLLFLEETHHWFARERVRRLQGDAAAAALREEIHAPRFDPPYAPLL